MNAVLRSDLNNVAWMNDIIFSFKKEEGAGV